MKRTFRVSADFVGRLWIVLLGLVGGVRLIRIHLLGGNNAITGDWLINYSGGFVRRGLSGHLLLIVSDVFNLTPIVSAGLFITGLWGITLWCLWVIWRRRSRELSDLILLVSPAFLAFNIWDFQGGFRKELLLLSYFLIFIVRFGIGHTKDSRLSTGVMWGIFFGCGVLVHEIFVLGLPFLAAIAFFLYGEGNLQRGSLIGLLSAASITSSFGAIVTFFYAGTSDQSGAICASLLERGAEASICGGAIRFIGAPLQVESYEISFMLFYLGGAALSFAPIIIFKFVTLRGTLMIFLSLGAFGALLPIAHDWGRWIYIAASLGTVTALWIGSRPGAENDKRGIEGKLTWSQAVCVSLWAFGWSLPHNGADFFGPGFIHVVGSLR